MPLSLRMTLGLGIVYGFLVVGYLARRRWPALGAQSPRMLRVALLVFDVPVIIMVAWLLSPEQREGVMQLPVIGTLLSLALIPMGWICARAIRLPRPEVGAMVCAASMSNLGNTFGGLLCLIILGIQGSALALAYALYFVPFTFLIMFQVAGFFASADATPGWGAMLRTFLGDPARWAPTAAIGVGIVVNVAAPRPPECMDTVATVLILVMTAGYSFAIGVGLRLGAIRQYLKPCFLMCALKFAVTPLVALLLIQCFSLTRMQQQTVFIESMTPVAIYSVVIAGVTGLARDLANSLWLVTTLVALPLVLPLYVIVTRCF